MQPRNSNLLTFGKWVEEFVSQKHAVEVPNYQRAYSWNEGNAEVFLRDLQQTKTSGYFLGLFLIDQSNEKSLNLVDGQQRFTTIYLLLFAIGKRFPDLLKSRWGQQPSNSSNNGKGATLGDFLFIDIAERTFRLTLQDGINREYFKTLLRNEIETEVKFGSQQKLKQVFEFFNSKVSEMSQDSARQILTTLAKSEILVHETSDVGKSMQIFELLNDRGKPLTDLEALKAYIMHSAYELETSDESRDDAINSIKSAFEKIYSSLSKAEQSAKRKFKEDDVLRYHFIAAGDWENTKKFSKAKNIIKSQLDTIVRGETSTKANEEPVGEEKPSKLTQIRCIADSIASSFEAFAKIQERANSDSDDYRWLKNLYLLDRMATFYPLLIAIEHMHPDDTEFLYEVCNYLELFVFRAFGILNKRSNNSQAAFYDLAREVHHDCEGRGKNKGDIINEISNIAKDSAGASSDEQFESGLRDRNFYNSQKGIDSRYLLVKYENDMVTNETSKEAQLIRSAERISKGDSASETLTVEHIIAQDLPNTAPHQIKVRTRGADSRSQRTDYFKKKEYSGYRDKMFEREFLHRLGNLVISTRPANSSKGKKLPEEKDWANWQSQIEIQKFIEANKEKKSWVKNYPFTIDEIMKREENICEFAKAYWSSNYFEPSTDGIDKDQKRNKLKWDISTRKPLI